jgi:hypothetical protein
MAALPEGLMIPSRFMRSRRHKKGAHRERLFPVLQE